MEKLHKKIERGVQGIWKSMLEKEDQLTALIREVARYRVRDTHHNSEACDIVFRVPSTGQNCPTRKALQEMALAEFRLAEAVDATNAHPDLQARIAREMEKK